MIRAKTRKARTPALSAANVWLELLIPVKFRSRTKGKEEFCSAPSSQEPSAGACLCWAGNTRCQLPHQLRGEWSQRCQVAAPHSFLPPLPASVLAAPGTRNPSDVSCPVRPSGTHSWRHKHCPAQPARHLGARGTVPPASDAIPSRAFLSSARELSGKNRHD